MAFETTIIADSICNGQRLTTMQLTHPRIVHAEFNTHCMFARNASSSRAIPFKKTVERVLNDPFIPKYWGVNQSGMQAFTELTGKKRETAIKKWLEARDNAVRVATEMAADGDCPACNGTGQQENSDHIFDCLRCGGDGLGLNVHKQIVNRLLEPFSWITVCVTGDWGGWSNYFALRCHPDAQPEIQEQAYMSQRDYYQSVPKTLSKGQWHTPYIRHNEFSEIITWLANKADGWAPSLSLLNDTLTQVSTGRCARTSYLTQEGLRDFSEDIKLHDRLRFHTPLHASPFDDTSAINITRRR